MICMKSDYNENADYSEKEEIILTGFSCLVEEWKHRFEESPNIVINFDVDGTNMLRLNGIALCPLSYIDSITSLTFEAETFWLVTNAGMIFEICLEWPYEKDPYIASIYKQEELYRRPILTD